MIPLKYLGEMPPYHFRLLADPDLPWLQIQTRLFLSLHVVVFCVSVSLYVTT